MVILKRIPRVLSPELLYTLSRMGHGDEIILADANFPSAAIGALTVAGVIRADGLDIPTLMAAILKLMPLDAAVAEPCALMQVMPQHVAAGMTTPIWATYKGIANAAEGKEVGFEEVERFAFYERAKKGFAVVATGEQALYGNIILKKGVLGPEVVEE